MIVISSREFRENQKKYFDLVDQNERVVIKRRNKSYELTSEVKNDRFFENPEILDRIEKSLRSLEEGRGIRLSEDEQRKLFET
ncbi:MAG: type II toxin-antitoxin system Phd/YefM family antitoxin [Mongoliitalea sp.]